MIHQNDPGGPAVKYGDSHFTVEIPESERPNDATIYSYEDGRRHFFQKLKSHGNMYSIPPKGNFFQKQNAEPFKITKNLKSKTLEKQLSKGYILSYLYYDYGTIKYNGLPKSGRFARDIDDKTLFHSFHRQKYNLIYRWTCNM